MWKGVRFFHKRESSAGGLFLKSGHQRGTEEGKGKESDFSGREKKKR
jgi:hypothetical protein